MAKRPLGGAGESRLGKLGTAETEVTARPKILKATVARRRNHSIRLSGTEEARLQRLIERISEEAGRPVKEPDILRGLLVLGEKSEPSQLLDAVKRAAFDAE